MTPEQMYLKIAELKGWTRIDNPSPFRKISELVYIASAAKVWKNQNGDITFEPPPWLTDLNAAMELLKEMHGIIDWSVNEWVVTHYDHTTRNPDPCLAICEAWLIEHGVKVD